MGALTEAGMALVLLAVVLVGTSQAARERVMLAEAELTAEMMNSVTEGVQQFVEHYWDDLRACQMVCDPAGGNDLCDEAEFFIEEEGFDGALGGGRDSGVMGIWHAITDRSTVLGADDDQLMATPFRSLGLFDFTDSTITEKWTEEISSYVNRPQNTFGVAFYAGCGAFAGAGRYLSEYIGSATGSPPWEFTARGDAPFGLGSSTRVVRPPLLAQSGYVSTLLNGLEYESGKDIPGWGFRDLKFGVVYRFVQGDPSMNIRSATSSPVDYLQALVVMRTDRGEGLPVAYAENVLLSAANPSLGILRSEENGVRRVESVGGAWNFEILDCSNPRLPLTGKTFGTYFGDSTRALYADGVCDNGDRTALSYVSLPADLRLVECLLDGYLGCNFPLNRLDLAMVLGGYSDRQLPIAGDEDDPGAILVSVITVPGVIGQGSLGSGVRGAVGVAGIQDDSHLLHRRGEGADVTMEDQLVLEQGALIAGDIEFRNASGTVAKLSDGSLEFWGDKGLVFKTEDGTETIASLSVEDRGVDNLYGRYAVVLSMDGSQTSPLAGDLNSQVVLHSTGVDLQGTEMKMDYERKVQVESRQVGFDVNRLHVNAAGYGLIANSNGVFVGELDSNTFGSSNKVIRGFHVFDNESEYTGSTFYDDANVVLAGNDMFMNAGDGGYTMLNATRTLLAGNGGSLTAARQRFRDGQNDQDPLNTRTLAQALGRYVFNTTRAYSSTEDVVENVNCTRVPTPENPAENLFLDGSIGAAGTAQMAIPSGWRRLPGDLATQDVVISPADDTLDDVTVSIERPILGWAIDARTGDDGMRPRTVSGLGTVRATIAVYCDFQPTS